MSTAITNIRDVGLLSLSCIVGALVAPMLPVVGLPLCAAGLGGLVFQGYRVPAAITAALSMLVSAWIRPVDPIAVGVALVAILIAAGRLRRNDAYTIGLWLAPVLGLGFAATELAAARLAGESLSAYLGSALDQATETFGASGAIGGIPVAELTATMVRLTPAVYMLLGVASAVPVLVALVWSATRSGAVIRPTPKLERVDLSPHVLWPLVIGVGFLAASRIWGGMDGPAATVGLNLLMVSRVILLVQGMALVAALLGRAGIKGPGLALGLGIALVVDSASWLVSLAGLSDFWVNFRRLNRDTSSDAPDRPAEGL